MKKFALTFLVLFSLGFVVQAGTETYSSKDVKQVVPPPCPEWYADKEWNLSIWGTHIFTAENWEDDEYIQSDHAWGGGADIKYFFHRYFGVGIEGWVVNARRFVPEFTDLGSGGFVDTSFHENRAVGAVKGTFTLRYPIKCSRFAPYVYGGIGVIFGGGEFETLEFLPNEDIITVHHDGEEELLGQVGGGFEVRLTRRIGWINDFSWNFVGRENSDFGMVRSGVNFAF